MYTKLSILVEVSGGEKDVPHSSLPQIVLLVSPKPISTGGDISYDSNLTRTKFFQFFCQTDSLSYQS